MTKNTRGNTSRKTLGTSLNDENLLSEEGKNIVEAIREDIKDLRLELCNRYDNEIKALKDEVKSLKELVSKLNEKVDDEDAYSRRDCVVLSGNGIPEATDGEIASNIAINLLKNVLN